MDGGSATEEPGELQSLYDVAIAFVLFLMLPAAAMKFFAPTSDLATRVENGSVVLLCGILPLVGFAWWRRASLPRRLRVGWSLGFYGAFLLAWVPLAMILYPYLVHLAGYEFHAQEPVQYYADESMGARLWIVLIVTCIGAPLAEEIFFRGFLFRAVQQVSTPVVAVVVTSILFGAVHEASVAIPVGVLGLCFGYIRMKTGGIGSSILIHMLHNSWTVSLVVANPEFALSIYDK
jgi:membrane protease YdiL (CAAX protease family)